MTEPTQAEGPPNLRGAPRCGNCRFARARDNNGRAVYPWCLKHDTRTKHFHLCDDYAEGADD